MFKGECDAGYIKKIFQHLHLLDNEVTMRITDEEIRINGIDKGHVIMHDIRLNKYLFNSYELTGPLTVTVDSLQLSNILKRAGTDETVVFLIDENKFIILFKDEHSERRFKLGVLDTSKDSPNPPRVDSPVKLCVPVSIIEKSVNDAKILDGKMTKIKFNYNSENNIFRLSSKPEYGDEESSLKYDNVTAAVSEGTTIVQSVFDSSYLDILLKFKNISEDWTLSLGENIPLKCIIKDNDVSLMFLIAPRIEEEA